MTERKPSDVTFETWIDKQIRTAQQRGDFDDLPGAGKPLPAGPDDEMWWVRDYIRREGLSSEALLPAPLQLRKEIERLPETVRELRSETAVREFAEELNQRIVAWMRAPSGPRVPVGRVDADEAVALWRASRQALADSAEAVQCSEPPVRPGRCRRWWRRYVRGDQTAR